MVESRRVSPDRKNLPVAARPPCHDCRRFASAPVFPRSQNVHRRVQCRALTRASRLASQTKTNTRTTRAPRALTLSLGTMASGHCGAHAASWPDWLRTRHTHRSRPRALFLGVASSRCHVRGRTHARCEQRASWTNLHHERAAGARDDGTATRSYMGTGAERLEE